MFVSRFPSLDDIGDENPNNYILSWADMTDPGSHQQAMVAAAILNNRDQYGDSLRRHKDLEGSCARMATRVWKCVFKT